MSARIEEHGRETMSQNKSLQKLGYVRFSGRRRLRKTHTHL